MPRAFPDDLSNLQAKLAAQRLAFGPLAFQAARVLRTSGALQHLKDCGQAGVTAEQLADAVGLSVYASRVLLEAGLGAELVQLNGERFVLTKVGYMLLMDPMTRVNMDFVHDVCYRPAFHLQEALEEGRPVGLKELGEWNNLYEGLAELPERIRRSWLAFDHFYSDGVFHQALPHVLQRHPRRLADVGGNTGKWALLCCQHDPRVRVTILDLEHQLAVARRNIEGSPHAGRISYQTLDVLSEGAELPEGHDAIWMSQFLDCFSEQQATEILGRATRVMGDEARLYILETLWDKQRYEAARLSVVHTSLYFAAVANGNSKMYHSDRLKACLAKAQLEVEAEVEGIGTSHTLLIARRAGSASA